MRNMEQAKAAMEQWLSYENLEDSLRAELAEQTSEDDIFDRFYMDLEFGTAGLRGIMGAGSNRMNLYTVRRATQGFADYLNEQKGSSVPSVAIAYDTRHHSEDFAREAAKVLSANGIKVWLFTEPTPTPVLSFAVRHHKCSGGIVITASHNPPQYNGYKVYDEHGCQITEEAAEQILKHMKAVPFFAERNTAGTIFSVPESTKAAYLDAVTACRAGIHCKDLRVVYSPLNGTGLPYVREALRRIGISRLRTVEEQADSNGDFPTCPYPNPEKPEALELGLELCRKAHADLLLATDPDSDRLGAAVRDGEDYRILTGNEMGILLLDFLCRKRPLPKDPVAVKTVVSTPLAETVAKKYGVEMRSVLTGFKYIGEQIRGLEMQGGSHRFIFGFEESCGFLGGSYVRDKDGVAAAMLFCEMAAWYKEKSLSLVQALNALYEEHGYYKNEVSEYSFPGASGMEKMTEILADLRKNPPKEIFGARVLRVTDYLKPTGLPPANMLEYNMEDGSRLLIRPSGTEPKLKVYSSQRS
ncbi:MAG: phospho-sugar mutase [Clostridiales bacterium]|nr:phospho-sugar mutase [Clostridiales bacterium]